MTGSHSFVSKDIVLIPEHWYLVRVVYADRAPIATIIQYLGIDTESDTPTFTGYEALGLPDHMEVIREVFEG